MGSYIGQCHRLISHGNYCRLVACSSWEEFIFQTKPFGKSRKTHPSPANMNQKGVQGGSWLVLLSMFVWCTQPGLQEVSSKIAQQLAEYTRVFLQVMQAISSQVLWFWNFQISANILKGMLQIRTSFFLKNICTFLLANSKVSGSDSLMK